MLLTLMTDKKKDYSYMKADENDGFVTIDPEIRKKFHAQPMEKKEKSLKATTFTIFPFEVFEQQEKPFDIKEQETMEFIENHLKHFKKPYIATSFGSDSIVLMHLVMRAAKNVGVEYPDMILNDTLNTFKEEKQYWADMIKLWGISDRVKLFKPPKDENDKQQTVWSIAKKVGHLPSFRKMKGGGKDKGYGSGGDTPECCNILKKATLKKYLKSLPKEERYDCHFVGTRAEESRMRMYSVLQRCRTYVIKTLFPYPIRAITPLSFWTLEDIKKYYTKHDIPRNPAYEAHNMERMGCASCPAHKYWEIRLAKDPTNEGLGMLRQNFVLMKQFIDDGTENPKRLEESVNTLKKYLKKDGKTQLTELQKERVQKIIDEFDYMW